MKYLLRNITFIVLVVYGVKRFLDPWPSEISFQAFSMTVLALMILYSFLPGILGVISLPRKGVGMWVLSFLLTFGVLFLMTVLLPFYRFAPTSTPFLNLGQIMLPSWQLSSFQAGFVSSLLISTVYNYLMWLGGRK